MTDLALADVVYARLFWGKPRTIGELAEDLAVPRRMVEASIEELRRRGAPVCTGSRGVWLTQDADELLANYRRLRSRAIHQLLNLRQLQKTANAMRGYHQETIWPAA
jgi:Mn-dependent DtxR family transcriptional regulator